VGSPYVTWCLPKQLLFLSLASAIIDGVEPSIIKLLKLRLPQRAVVIIIIHFYFPGFKLQLLGLITS
jgi:hypothetical protein